MRQAGWFAACRAFSPPRIMLDFDAGKLLIIGLVALVVIGPKDLPRVLRQVGQAVGKLRRMAGEFQGQFMDAMKEADLQDIKAELAKIKDTTKLDVDFNPVRDIKEQMTSALADPKAEAASDAPMMTGTPDGGVSGFELPAPAEVELAHAEATVGAGGIGPAATFEPLPSRPIDIAAPPSETLVDLPTATLDIEADALERDSSLPDGAASTSRRKIVVTRRRRLSRLDGPTLRAAVLAGHSRNIRPARRDTTEP